MKKGFTFIELLIVLSIVLIFSGTGLVYFNTYNQKIRLKAEVKKLADVFDLARQKALSSDLYDPSCANFLGYRLILSATGQSYNIRFGCDSSYQLVQNYTLPTNIIVSQGAGSTITFPRLGLGMNITTNNIELKNTSTNSCVNISVTSNGVIQVNDILYPC